jgi:hypothetical protein
VFGHGSKLHGNFNRPAAPSHHPPKTSNDRAAQSGRSLRRSLQIVQLAQFRFCVTMAQITPHIQTRKNTLQTETAPGCRKPFLLQ